MIGLPANTPIYLCTDPVDFRKGFDGLTGIVTTTLGHTVTDGSLFLFVNQPQAGSYQSPVVGYWRTDTLVSKARTGHRRIAESSRRHRAHRDRQRRTCHVDRRRVAQVGQEQTQANVGVALFQNQHEPAWRGHFAKPFFFAPSMTHR